MSVFIIMAALFNILESTIPKPMPWFRIGLGNIFILSSIVIMGLRQGMIVGIGKVITSGLVLGTIFSPAFFMSLSGTVLSIIIMFFIWKFFRRVFSLIGVSIIGSIAHNFGQLIIILIIMKFHKSIYLQIPFIILFGTISGFITGIITNSFLKKWEVHRSIPPNRE
ncbi:MAG: Gx transporter family protein [bacterium]|nr:Gx transporter family protein [bacterium]